MYIAEIQYPGTWLKSEPPEEAHQKTSLFYVLESSLFDAAIALTLFEQSSESLMRHSREEMAIRRGERAGGEDEANLRSQLRAKYEAAIADGLDPERRWQAQGAVYDQVERDMRRHQWHAGRIPRQYAQQLPAMYAKNFLFSLDSVANIIRVLSAGAGQGHKIHEVRQDWLTTFPTVQGLRDTAHHMEDRARGLRRREQPLNLQPVDTQMVNAPGGVLILNCLNGNKFGGTVEDGSFAEVEVSHVSLEACRKLIQQTLEAFDWHGPPRSAPV